jgi:uncharacterized membrane protein
MFPGAVWLSVVLADRRPNRGDPRWFLLVVEARLPGHMVSQKANTAVPAGAGRRRMGLGRIFTRFFVRGLAALLPTIITLWLLVEAWSFLWNTVGQYLILALRESWVYLAQDASGSRSKWLHPLAYQPVDHIHTYWDPNYPNSATRTYIVGVGLAILLVYIVGIFVGNLIGRTLWRVVERWVMRIPLVRAIYPAVKQVTDFVLTERTEHFVGSRVVAVQPHAKGIWSVGMVTSSGRWPTGESGAGQDMVTVFVPSTPTAFSGYVLVVPRSSVVELPLTVEEAMRLLVSGGVISPTSQVTGELEEADLPAAPAGLRTEETVSGKRG